MIDSTAIIDKDAKLADDVSVGPYTIIGPQVEIAAGTKIEAHVMIKGPTKIGKDNHIFQFASVGEMPQDLKYGGEDTRLEIGDRNRIREFVTLNRGTVQGGGVTKIGNDNLLMAYVHLGHDCLIGDHVILANNATLAGHVIVHDHAILGGLTAVHQFSHIGSYSICAGGSMMAKDVAPFVLMSGNFAKPYGLNIVGLKRHGFTADELLWLKRAYKEIYRKGQTNAQIIPILKEMMANCKWIQYFIDAIERSERGLAK